MAEIHVQGLRELHRAFSAADKAIEREFRKELRGAVEVVRADAESLAVSRIRRIGIPWSRMRVGITRHSVYVAPRQRGRGTNPNRKRPILAGLLLTKAMEPALDQNVEGVVQDVEGAIDHMSRVWERA